MTVRMMPAQIYSQAMEYMRPAFVQTAALCLRTTSNGAEVMLVRTLERGLWVIPKGWPMKNMSLAEAAACEAWEEAGLRGHIGTEAVGHFTYTKIKKSGLPVQCRAHVFRLDVTHTSDNYPEAKKRIRAWVSPSKAVELVHNPELKAILAQI